MDVVDCEGAPRDLGGDQGRACREALRALCAGRGVATRVADALGRLDAGSARALRDLRRHYPHQWEWLEGLASGARLPLPALARAMLAALAEPAPAALVALEGERRIAALAPADARVRRARPEGRFASLELTRPALTTALLGVNEAGLAVGATPAAAPARSGCAAPSALLVRDCLERFASVEAALEWCLGRPAAGAGAVALVDATGALAGVVLSGRERRVVRAVDGALALGARRAEVAKALGAPSGDAALARALARGAAAGEARLAVVDAVGRSLRAPDGEVLALG